MAVKHLPGLHDQSSHGRRRNRASVVSGVLAGDFSDLKPIGGRRGYNEAGLYQAPDGTKWYVKEQITQDHANNEVLAGALYRELGIAVPDTHVGSGAPGLTGPQTASRWIDTESPDTRPTARGDKFLRDIQGGFAVDAWLANWDVVGAGGRHNIESVGGKPLRVESGGAMLYGGTGGSKGAAFGDTVGEWDTLRSKAMNPSAASVFGSMTDIEVADSTDQLKNIQHSRIRELVAAHGMDGSLADRLIARRADLLARAISARERASRPSRVGGTASLTPAQAQQMQDGMLAGKGWSDDQAAALHAYTDDGYRDINGILVDPGMRPGPGGALSASQARGAIPTIRSAMRPLPQPITVWRGVDRESAGMDPGATDFSSLAGKLFQNHGFSSTSVDRDAAVGVRMDEYEAILQIDVPAGTSAAYLESVTAFAGEFEVLLDAGTTFEYLDVDGEYNGWPVIRVRVVPR